MCRHMATKLSAETSQQKADYKNNDDSLAVQGNRKSGQSHCWLWRETVMQKIVNGYFHLLKVTMVLCLVLMVILVFGNVVLRYGFNSGITVSEELSRMFFVYLTFCGAIVAMRDHLHLGVDSLVKRLPVLG